MEAAVLQLDVNRKKLNKAGAQCAAMCPPRIDNTNIRPNSIYFLKEWNRVAKSLLL